MSEKSKHKRNLGPRGIKEIFAPHSTFEPPPGRFKDLFKNFSGTRNEGRDSKASFGAKSSQSNSPLKRTSQQKD